LGCGAKEEGGERERQICIHIVRFHISIINDTVLSPVKIVEVFHVVIMKGI